MQFLLPMTANCFFPSTIQAKNSRKRRTEIGDDKIRFITKFGNFFASEIPVTIHILPFESSILIRPSPLLSRSKMNILPFHLCLGRVELRRFLLKQELIRCFVFFAIRCITRRNQFFQA